MQNTRRKKYSSITKSKRPGFFSAKIKKILDFLKGACQEERTPFRLILNENRNEKITK